MNVRGRWEGMDALSADFAKLKAGMQGQALRGALRAAASPVVKAAQRDAPSRRVKKALTSVIKGRGVKVEARVGAKKGTAGAKLLHLIEKGTRPHTIRANQRKVLAVPHSIRVRRRFAQYDAGIVFGKEVQHPGARARPFFKKALDSNHTEVERKFKSALGQIVDRMHLRVLKQRG